MPIYEFQCQACGTEIEVLQKINDPHLTVCEACGESAMKKKVTAAAFRLSGAGWYETDFKAGDKKKNLTETATDKKDKNDQNSEGAKTTANEGSDKSSDKSSEKATTKAESSTVESNKPKKSKESSTD